MGFTPGGSGEPGSLFHWVTRTGTGIARCSGGVCGLGGR